MLVVFMSYLPYLPGDENYNMDSLLNLSTATLLEQQFGASQFSLYPNPFHEGINIYSNNVSAGDKVSVYIYDTQGKLVKPLMKGQTLTNNELLIEWDGKNEVNKPASPGLYFLSINVNGVMTQHRVIKQ